MSSIFSLHDSFLTRGWWINVDGVCVLSCACLSSCSLAIRRRRSLYWINSPGPWWRATSGSTRAPGSTTAASVWGRRYWDALYQVLETQPWGVFTAEKKKKQRSQLELNLYPFQEPMKNPLPCRFKPQISLILMDFKE